MFLLKTGLPSCMIPLVGTNTTQKHKKDTAVKKINWLLWLLILTTLTGCLVTSPAPAPLLPWEAPHGSITPYRYTSRNAPLEPKAYTIMVYLNGSDLETDHRAATMDLAEMVQSGFDEEHVNLIVFTGGTRRWHLPFIPNNRNAIFQLEQNTMTRIANADNLPMGDPAVLAGFVNFCKTYYPAEHYGLILWNHGGGAISGFGHDEVYQGDPSRTAMSLRDIDRALEASVPPQGLEFLGFDTCLMATLEMADIGAKYARYLIASQDLEPADGWDYAFLGHIQPGDTGADIGVNIIRYYEAFYQDSDVGDILTLSLVDLSKIEAVYTAFEHLAHGTNYALASGGFPRIAKARANARVFGGEMGTSTDMVDLAQLARNLGPVSPREARLFEAALSHAVLYQYHNYPGELGGLSIYFPFANKQDLPQSMAVYKELNQLPYYTRLLTRFAHKLLASPEDAPTDPPTALLILNGHPVSACEVARNPYRTRYAIPIRQNGKDASLLVFFEEGEDAGKIIGAVPAGEDVFNRMNRKVLPVSPDDTITLP